MIPGLESALNSKQSTIDLDDGIQNFIYPQGLLYFQTVSPPVGFMGLPVARTGLFLDMTNLYTKAEVDNLRKPLCAGHIDRANLNKLASIGRIDFDLNLAPAGTGISNITLASALPNTNYLVQVSLYNTTAPSVGITNKTTSSFTISTRLTNGSLANCELMFVVHH